jgi:SP family arabinose:H+ symporter-like MFS transporter
MHPVRVKTAVRQLTVSVNAMRKGGSSSLFLILVAVSAATAGLLYGYDVGVISGAVVFLRSSFRLDAVQTEIITSIAFWGCALGAAVGGWASDRFGRRIVLFSAGLLFCVAAASAAAAHDFARLLTARLLAGVAIGLALLIAPLYIAEVSPAAVRGRLVTLNQLAIVSGILLGYLCNYELAQITHDNWRWMFAVGAAPAVLLCFALLLIPESPRWLLEHGRRDQALSVLRRMLPAAELDHAIDEIGASIREESGTYRELFGRSLRKPLVLAIMLAIINQITGINTVLFYGAIIFSEHAGATASSAIGMNVVVGLVNLVFTILGLVLIDKLGRRPLLLVATGGMGISLVVFAVLLHALPGRSVLLLIPVLGYVAFFAFGLGTGVWVCMAELFPNRIRGRAMSIATMVLWISVSGVMATFLSLINLFTPSGVFYGYSLLCAISFLYIYFQLPETKNRTLEEIASLWSAKKEAVPTPK